MVLIIILFIAGLLLLIKGGDWFVEGATGIAKAFNIPEILIGATVVSIGTTLPEVMVSADAAFSGYSGIAYGNAIGSIICNTSLICAITVAIKPAEINKKPLTVPVIFFFVSALIYSFIAIYFKEFTRAFGIGLLLIFVIYMIYCINNGRKEIKNAPKEEGNKKVGKDIVFLIIGAVMIAVGARLLVDNGTKIAEMLGVPDSVIGLTIVALGTSLPELVTAITSLIKGHGALSLGNIIGANLFNIVLVSGTAITIKPFEIPAEKTIMGLNSSFLVDIPVMFLVMGILTIPALISGKLKRWQGILLLLIYAGFCVFQFA